VIHVISAIAVVVALTYELIIGKDDHHFKFKWLMFIGLALNVFSNVITTFSGVMIFFNYDMETYTGFVLLILGGFG